MDAFLLQDWTALSSSGAALVQSEAGWLDLAGYRDVVAWLEFKEASSTSIQLAYQSSVTKEEALFATMATASLAGGPGVVVTPMLADLQTGATGAAPLARWVRWQLSLSGSAFDITFRIWIAANKPGRAMINRRNHAHVRPQ